MNEYKDAVDVMARYISDCKIGIKRYSDRDIDNVMAKIVELENHCDKLEHELEVLKEDYSADQEYIECFDITKEFYWKKIKQLDKALYKASKILEEGYGEEYASYIYMKNIDEGIEIPSHMNINEWKEWLMNDE